MGRMCSQTCQNCAARAPRLVAELVLRWGGSHVPRNGQVHRVGQCTVQSLAGAITASAAAASAAAAAAADGWGWGGTSRHGCWPAGQEQTRHVNSMTATPSCGEQAGGCRSTRPLGLRRTRVLRRLCASPCGNSGSWRGLRHAPGQCATPRRHAGCAATRAGAHVRAIGA